MICEITPPFFGMVDLKTDKVFDTLPNHTDNVTQLGMVAHCFSA